MLVAYHYAGRAITRTFNININNSLNIGGVDSQLAMLILNYLGHDNLNHYRGFFYFGI